MLLGTCSQGGRNVSPTGVSPTTPDHPRPFGYTTTFSLPEPVVAGSRTLPQPQPRNPYQVSHGTGLASSAFARHYSRNHYLFSLPVGTEMFHFPTFPLPALYIQAGVTRSPCSAQRGFPIRKSSDQSSIISSPRLIADLYVGSRCQGIHRLLLEN